MDRDDHHEQHDVFLVTAVTLCASFNLSLCRFRSNL